MEYETQTVDNSTDSLPPDLPIDKIRFQTSSGRSWSGPNYYRIKDKAVKVMAEAGIRTLSDLEGWTKSELEEFSGIGEVGAERLLNAADLADVQYRGDDFPWEVEVTVRIPRELVELVDEFPESDVQEALRGKLETADVLEALKEELLERQAEKLEEKKQELLSQADELDGQIEKYRQQT